MDQTTEIKVENVNPSFKTRFFNFMKKYAPAFILGAGVGAAATTAVIVLREEDTQEPVANEILQEEV